MCFKGFFNLLVGMIAHGCLPFAAIAADGQHGMEKKGCSLLPFFCLGFFINEDLSKHALIAQKYEKYQVKMQNGNRKIIILKNNLS